MQTAPTDRSAPQTTQAARRPAAAPRQEPLPDRSSARAPAMRREPPARVGVPAWRIPTDPLPV